MRLLNFTVIGSLRPFIILKARIEGKKKLNVIEKTIRDCIINDILEVCKEDMESKQKNKCPEKIIKELMRWIFEHEKL